MTFGMKRHPQRRCLTIDPGLNIGWSLWDLGSSRWRKLEPPLDAGSFREHASLLEWRDRAIAVCQDFDEWFSSGPTIDTVAIEWPFVGGGAAPPEDILKLQFIVGWLSCVCNSWGAKLVFVPVHVWKGQMSKELTTKRIVAQLGEEFMQDLDNHALDAVGIGLHLKGFSFG